jgi:DNA (cytosine-5)-methyltransferase 1
MTTKYSSIELCAGAGGQALGLHQAGFKHKLLIEIENPACRTLRANNINHALGWDEITEGCIEQFATRDAYAYRGIDLVAGGVPCPPFSKAGKQLGKDDERDLFPAALEIAEKVQPNAVMLENVAGLLEARFNDYRSEIDDRLNSLGYQTCWKLHHASDYGVPQLRPRAILVALKPEFAKFFRWPQEVIAPLTVGETLYDLMAIDGWEGAKEWRKRADKIAPTLVGGSKKHGGPDLGPTRAKRAWQELWVNGHIVGDRPPEKGYRGYKNREGFEDMPLLTVRMAARIQGFPDWWEFYGKKTPAYRQVGNAFPPPVARAIGQQIIQAFDDAKGKAPKSNHQPPLALSSR